MNPTRHSKRRVLAALFGAAALASARALELGSHVISGGGGSSQAGRFRLDGSLGQAVAASEASVSANARLRSGFWAQWGWGLGVVLVAHEDLLERRRGQAGHVLLRTILENDVAADLWTLELVEADVVSAAGGSVLQDGPWLIYQPPTAAPDPGEDAFTYRVRDVLGAVAIGTVRVRLAALPPGGLPNALEIQPVAGDPPLVRVRFQGVAGRTYKVQSASDLPGPWTNQTSLSAGPDGAIVFIETLGIGPRYFRIVEPETP